MRLVARIGRRTAVPILLASLATAAVAEQSIIQREMARRAESAKEAQLALERGDKAYEAGNYADAVNEYSKAVDALPKAGQTSALRAEAAERLAVASAERARQLAKIGEFEKADALLENALDENIAPNHVLAQQRREEIQDPIRYNHAVTPQHVRNVDEVRRHLYEAEGFGELGQFDRARTVYEEVLRLDPTNTAARRGMEAATKQRHEYFKSAYDEARAAMLTEVSQSWEIPPPKAVLAGDLAYGEVLEAGIAGRSAREKLSSMILPFVDLDQVGLEEAIDFLRQQSNQLDLLETDPNRRGISFIVELGNADPERTRKILDTRFNLSLKDIPMEKVLKYIHDATGTQSRIDEHAIVIRPVGALGNELYTRSWRVPPDFLSREAMGAGGAAEEDPFGGDDDKPKGLVSRLTAQEFLKKLGVSFPEGAGARFSSSTSQLTVRNTSVNLDIIEQIVDTINSTEPLVIQVEVRLITATQENLEELDFDWKLQPIDVHSEVYLGGGTTGTGQPIVDLAPGNAGPVTAGNRSGARASNTNTIDGAINRSRTGTALGGVAGAGIAGLTAPATSTGVSDLRAPGILSVFGFINDSSVSMLMRGVSQHKGVDLLTKKSVYTRPGQSATIESVEEFIYPTEYEPPELPNSTGGSTFIDTVTGEAAGGTTAIATPATPTAFDMRKLGCILEVLPQVGADRNIIEVQVKPEVTRFDGFVNYGTPIIGGSSSVTVNLAGIGNANVPSFFTNGTFGEITSNDILMPVFSTIRTDANLVIADGQTIVMGGLLTNSVTKIQDKTPILGDLPLIGRFFQSDALTHERSALIILVTVRLQDPSGRLIRDR